MVLAWQMETAERCPDCGTYYEEWDPKTGGHVHAYYARSLYCLGCKAKADLHAAVQENQGKGEKSVTNGLQVRLERNENAPRLRSPQTGKPINPITR